MGNIIVELTEETEVDKKQHIENIILTVCAWTYCPDCGHVDNGLETRMNHSCETCGKPCECRRILYEYGEHQMLSMIYECYLSEYSKPACVLLYCSLIEMHVRRLLTEILYRRGWKQEQVQELLKHCQGIDKRKSIIKKYTGKALHTILEGSEVAPVLTRFKELQKIRHSLAHGLRQAGWINTLNEKEIKEAVILATDSMSAFAALYHELARIVHQLICIKPFSVVLMKLRSLWRVFHWNRA